MAYWYAYVKANLTTYMFLTSSASAITELGSVMGKKKIFFIQTFNNSWMLNLVFINY